MFEGLHKGQTTFTLDMSQACTDCFNVRLLKVVNLLGFPETCALCSSQLLLRNTFSLPSIIIMATANEPLKQRQTKWIEIYQSQLTSVTLLTRLKRIYVSWEVRLDDWRQWKTSKAYFVEAVDLSRVRMFLKIAINIGLFYVSWEQFISLERSGTLTVHFFGTKWYINCGLTFILLNFDFLVTNGRHMVFFELLRYIN